MTLIRSEAIGHGPLFSIECPMKHLWDQTDNCAYRMPQEAQNSEIVAITRTERATTIATITNKSIPGMAKSEGSQVTPSSPPKRTRAASAPANLHEAVAAGDLSAVETYIAQGKVDAAESAASTCPSSVLSAMLAVSGVEGAAVAAGCGTLEVRDWRGRTPLHIACEHGRTDVVRALLAGGAIANATDRDGFQPLHKCAQTCNLDSARALLLEPQRRQDVSGKHAYIISAAAAAADVNARSRRGGYSPLHLACLLPLRPSLMAAAAAEGAPESESEGKNKEMRRMSTEVVKLLLEKGADVAAVDRWGCTPLHRACLEGHLEAARAVLDAGADVNAADDWKCTPLHRSCHSGDVEIAALLVKHGASLSTRDDQMERPGQRFADGISAERREAIKKILAVDTGRNAAPPSWARTRSADTAQSSIGKTSGAAGRYVPPGARRSQSMVILDSNDGVSGGMGGEAGGTETGAVPRVSATQPWRRKSASTPPKASGGDVTGKGDDGASGDIKDTVIKMQPWRRASIAVVGSFGECGPDIGEDGRAVETTIEGGGSPVGGDRDCGTSAGCCGGAVDNPTMGIGLDAWAGREVEEQGAKNAVTADGI